MGSEPMYPTSQENALNICVSKSSHRLGKSVRARQIDIRSVFPLKISYANKEDKSFPNCFSRQSFQEVRVYKYQGEEKRLTVLIISFKKNTCLQHYYISILKAEWTLVY